MLVEPISDSNGSLSLVCAALNLFHVSALGIYVGAQKEQNSSF